MHTPSTQHDAPTPELDEFEALVGRARGGDEAALDELRTFLDAHPALAAHVGDLAAHVERDWVALAAGADPLVREALARRLAALKDELAGPAPAPLVRLLAERAAAAWLQTTHADALAARIGAAAGPAASLALRRQESAQKRYLAALKALALVKKLRPSPAATPPLGSPAPAVVPFPSSNCPPSPDRSYA
jgi:hypothetical protein